MKDVNPEQEFFIFDATSIDFRPLTDEELEQLKSAKKKWLKIKKNNTPSRNNRLI